ncbi:uncharacterized protein LOC129768693 [Toxorhynchites rutilus septentrionalis]|uniref:uncharacterized protein LOC129768693 n=1 Tax=Toxorhynchites rutilus septentrionalis TaxID=329112 RepID=UPI00247939B9|nr:uncharacterized protein LOC129768693 [Toxorhynchites rutilus septentrionalis]
MSRAETYLALCLLDAFEDENLESIRVLLAKHGANPNVTVLERNVAPVHLVIGLENCLLAEQATSLLLEHKANPNLRSIEEGMTPLHIAASLGRPRMVEMLIRAGGDINLKDNDLKTPVQYAIEEGHFEVVKIMQNVVFEQKFDRKREQVLQKESSNNGGYYVKCLGGYLKVTTPTKNALSPAQALEESKLTPNRVHYNFDCTSPYYINITHRRKDRSKRIIEDVDQRIVDLQLDAEEVVAGGDDIVVGRKNLFELTERNLANFTKNMAEGGRRSSFIECWRDKIAILRDRNKLSTHIDDIEKILTGFSTSFDEHVHNTLLSEQIQINVNLTCSELERNTSFRTAQEQIQCFEDSLRTNEFAKALCCSPEVIQSSALNRIRIKEELIQTDEKDLPSPSKVSALSLSPTVERDSVVQITEEYVHTDDEVGLVFYEKKFLAPAVGIQPTAARHQRNPSISSRSTVLSLPPPDYDTDTLRAELTQFGEPPGPITKHTKKLYLKKLVRYKRDPDRAQAQSKDKQQPNYSVELLSTLRNEDVFSQITEHCSLETEMSSEFQTSSNAKSWREGHLKKSFIYLLIDPRLSENLPAQQRLLKTHDIWKRFLLSIFYVGKGKSSRPYCHLYDAMKLYQQKSVSNRHTSNNSLQPPSIVETNLLVEEEQILFQSEEHIERFCRTSKILNRKQMNDSQKLNRIIDIWRSQQGVICLHVFHNIMPAEAYTREAAIIDALGIHNLTNLKRGDYYGKSIAWPLKRRKQLGILLLYKAMLIFLAEGETQLLPSDLI